MIAMTRLALLVQPFYVHASVAVAGITRERFQATVHTLLDDEMNGLLPTSTREDNTIPTGSVPGSRTLSKASKRAAPHKLRDHMLNETAKDTKTGELDILFDEIVTHGWDSVLLRSLEDGDNDEIFLVCYNSPPSFGIDRKQAILGGLNMSDCYFNPIHSTLEDLCGIVAIPGSVGLNWHTQNNGNSVNDNLNLALLPWTDVMKIAPNILSQVHTNDSSNYSLVFSIVKSNALAQNILKDVVEMINSGQRQRRQQGEKHVFRDSFSLARLASKIGSESDHHWSRMLEDKDCSSMLVDFVVIPFRDDSNYQIHFDSSPSPDCIASLIVGLSVHAAVSRVGTIVESVKLHNMHASWLVQGGVSDSKGNEIFSFHSAGLKGQNQHASISDTGLDVHNCYFRDSISTATVPNQVSIFEHWNISSKILRYDYDSSGGDLVDETRHGTHVSATILGSHINGLGPEKNGIAPAAKAHFYDICTGTRCISPSQRWFESVNSNLVVKPKVMSASWGTGFLTSYDWTCLQYDSLIAENPDVILIASSGNRGGPHPTIGAPASCKNSIAVGASFNDNYGPLTSVASFSSRGPSSDMRIKPDIVAPGYKLSSALAGHHDCFEEEPTFLRAGTSMAAPIVSGMAILIRQYFEEGFYPCGSRECGLKIIPSGSLVKAVILNGGQPLESVVHASTGVEIGDTQPYDNIQGFGNSNLMYSLPLQNKNDFGIYVRNNEIIRFAQVHSFNLTTMNLDRCSSNLSVTLTWYDPPGIIGCTSCLVNDLDLVVEEMSSSVKHYPNGKSTPDRINNVERVRIASSNLSSGQQWRISVTASNLGVNHHEQKYSLVVTGCFQNNGYPTQPSQTQVTTQSTEHELTTSYRTIMSRKRAAGIMFSVKAKSYGVAVNSFAIRTHLKEDDNMFVYKLRDFGHRLNETELNNESYWDMISPIGGFELNATGTRELTVLPPDAFHVPIPKGLTQTFYITFGSTRAIVCGQPRGTIKQQRRRRRDENIKIDVGNIGRLQAFAGRVIDPCFFDGTVIYSVEHTDVFD